jgi:hemoglobin
MLQQPSDSFKVPADPILAPIFARMSADHVRHVSAFVAEVFGGP